MASEEHLNNSDFVKSVHRKLRDDAKLLGPEAAWQKHCEDDENLKKYAASMRDLATKHWDINGKSRSETSSRIEWSGQFIRKYFIDGEIENHRAKETRIANKIGVSAATRLYKEIPKTKIKLLDVGSCYNPFKTYPFLEVLPIDIAPAGEDVYKCDFLNVQLDSGVFCVIESEVQKLQIEGFDVVVFSLVLEYLPCPKQRYSFCKRAYQLLKSEGILIIITPDSKHVGANAKIMKSWRFLLAKMGYIRLKYEKLTHVHCMVFRKTPRKEIAARWATLQDQTHFFNDIVIPQDFNQATKEHPLRQNYEKCDINLFGQLPQEF